MNVVYLITDTVKNVRYLGSKKDWLGGMSYVGSPSIKNKSHPKYNIQQEWKLDVKERPQTFLFEVMEDVQDYLLLKERELYYQIKYDVVNSKEFINGAYARKHFFGIPKGFKFDKDRIALLKTRGAWNKTELQKYKNKIAHLGKKYSVEINKKKGRSGNESASIKSIKIDDKIYLSIQEAAIALGVTRQTIRNRLLNMPNYNYINYKIKKEKLKDKTRPYFTRTKSRNKPKIITSI